MFRAWLVLVFHGLLGLPLRFLASVVLPFLWRPAFEREDAEDVWHRDSFLKDDEVELLRIRLENRLVKKGEWERVRTDGDWGKIGGLLSVALGEHEKCSEATPVWWNLFYPCVRVWGFQRPSGSDMPWSMAQMAGLNWAITWRVVKGVGLTAEEHRRLAMAIRATIASPPRWHFGKEREDDAFSRAWLARWWHLSAHWGHLVGTLAVWEGTVRVGGVDRRLAYWLRIMYWTAFVLWLPGCWWPDAFVFVSRYFWGRWHTAHTTALHLAAGVMMRGTKDGALPLRPRTWDGRVMLWVLQRLARIHWHNPGIVLLAGGQNRTIGGFDVWYVCLYGYNPDAKTLVPTTRLRRYDSDDKVRLARYYDLRQVWHRWRAGLSVRPLRWQVMAAVPLPPWLRGSDYLWERNPLKVNERTREHNVVDWLHLDRLRREAGL